MSKPSSRDKLIEATASLLQKQGYYGTGLNEIVQTSGAPKGSLYFHFPGGKEELAAEALALNGAAWRAQLSAATDGADLAGALDIAIDAIAARLESSDFVEGCPIATVTLEAAATSDRIQAVAQEAYESWEAIIGERLAAAGVKEASEKAVMVLSCIEGALMLARAYRSRRPLDVVRRQLRALLS